jgi:hypothetical protein
MEVFPSYSAPTVTPRMRADKRISTPPCCSANGRTSRTRRLGTSGRRTRIPGEATSTGSRRRAPARGKPESRSHRPTRGGARVHGCRLRPRRRGRQRHGRRIRRAGAPPPQGCTRAADAYPSHGRRHAYPSCHTRGVTRVRTRCPIRQRRSPARSRTPRGAA